MNHTDSISEISTTSSNAMDFPEPKGLGLYLLPHVAKQEKENLRRETKKLKAYEKGRHFFMDKCDAGLAYVDLALETSLDQDRHIVPVR
jgi:hypothetical protein